MFHSESEQSDEESPVCLSLSISLRREILHFVQNDIETVYFLSNI